MAKEIFSPSYKISFQLEKRKSNGALITENVPIQMIITFNSKRVKTFVGHRIDSVMWDEETSRVVTGAKNKKGTGWDKINTRIKNLDAFVTNYMEDFRIEKRYPTTAEVTQAVKALLGKEPATKPDAFFDALEAFVAQQSKEKNWSTSTIKKFRTVKNNLTAFTSSRPLSFDAINPNLLQNYFEWLQKPFKPKNKELRAREPYRNTTCAKEFKLIKWFLKWAVESEYTNNVAFAKYKPKFIGSTHEHEQIVFLTKEELKKLQELDPKKEYLIRTKDVFLFCCFTGLRYSDVANLTKADIKANHIAITTQKTNDALTIQFNKHSKAIIDKYKDVPLDNLKALPVISNQKMNKYLKELCELAGINELQKVIHYVGNERIEDVKPKYELIGTHTGRRTFISNAIASGISAEVVIKWTGHKDFKAMSPYLKIMEKTKQQEMAKFDLW